MDKARSPSLLKTTSYLAVLIWVLMMATLLQRTYLSPLLSRPAGWSPPGQESFQPGESWMGIYLQERKIGYSHTRWEKEGLDLRMMERTVMELMLMGSPQTVHLSTQCLLAPSLSLKSFSFALSAEGVNFSAEGEVQGKRMRIHLSGIGEKREMEVPLKGTPFLWPNLRLFLKGQELKEGKDLRVELFDPITLSLQDLHIEMEGSERLRVGKEERKAVKLRQTYKGMTVRSWIDESGEILREESPLGFTLVKEEKEAAILRGRGKGKAGDLIALAAVASPVEIPDPQAIRVMKIRLVGASMEGLDLDGGRQRVKGNVLEIQRESLDGPSPALPFQQPGLEAYLSPTPFIQSDDPQMRQMTQTILKGEQNSLEAARKIASWVYGQVEKRPTLSIPSALEVLRNRVGDCNEHTILFAGLARAAGLPTKVVAGLVYARGKFYYHAWPEVFMGRWIAIDPTLNQFPADATHIRLIEGGLERQTEIVRLIGKLSLEILGWQ